MNFHDRKVIPPKYIYLFLTVICLIMLILSIVFESRFVVLKSVTSALITPMQTGVNAVGYSIHSSVVDTKEKKELIAENKELLEKLEEYKSKNKEYEQKDYELERLQKLLELKEQYIDYNTVGARVIATDSTNWFYSFIINKGTESGINVGCNVLADGGLAGIVIEAGNGYAKVRSIIDDNSKVSAVISGADSLCTVSGDISTMKDGYIHVNYIDKADVIDDGAELVTSHVSNKFLPGILIGYISDVQMDSNNLTQSAKCIPVVDFSNLSEVLVVLDLKTTYKTNSRNKNIYDGVNLPDNQVPEDTSSDNTDSTEVEDNNTGNNDDNDSSENNNSNNNTDSHENSNNNDDNNNDNDTSNDNNDNNRDNDTNNDTNNIDNNDNTDNNGSNNNDTGE